MNTRSLSFRLSAWVIVLFLVSTLVSFGAFYLVTKQLLYSHTDSFLTAHGNKVVEVATSQDAGMHDTIAKEAFIRQFSEIPGMLVVITDAGGMVVSSSAAGRNSPIFIELFDRVKEEKRPFFTDRTIGEVDMRWFILPIMKNKTLVGSVLVAHPIDVITKSLGSLIATEAMVFLALVIPVSMGGYFMVNRGLLPISAMAQTMARIESTDLTQRAANPKTGDALENLAEAFNGLLDRLKTSFTRERQFIGDVAHEVKTPLSTISGTAEVALSKPRSKQDYQKALVEILTDASKMSSTLRNVMDLAWSQSESSGLTTESFSLSEMIEELAEVATKLAQAKHIVVKSKIEKKITITGKKDKLYRAVLNLIDNAIKFTPGGGKVWLALVSQKGVVKVEVADNGVGIAAVDVPHIFERYYRGSKPGKTLGSGLGLAIAASIIAAHNGRIEVESAAGKGSKFSVVLAKL